ncbi:hypothetical protein [Bradyrhizobium sp. Arg816]|nr:hypothetical protein [Bradyrhizobium sp. Arg816]MDI3563541.1 hypothetical protein [Bradyrhizobium sp. Arg816]
MIDVPKEFYIRHFRMLVQQAIIVLGKAQVQKILDEAEVGG